MKSTIAKNMLGLALSLVVTQTFAFDLPGSLVGTWNAIDKTTTPDIVVINADKGITYSMSRQVGTQGGKVPYPTICYYKEVGAISSISLKGNDMDIFYSVNHIELIQAEAGSTIESCEEFIKESQGAYYHWTITMQDQNTIQDTWYKTIFKKN